MLKQQARLAYAEHSDAVIRMFTDPDYFRRKYEIQGAEDIELLEHRQQGDQFSVQFQRSVPAEVPLPSFARKFVPGLMTVIQRDSWDAAAKTGRLDIELKGVPGQMHCEMELVDTSGGCELVLNWAISANIPLVGGKLEKVLWEDLQKKMASDAAVGAELIRNYL